MKTRFLKWRPVTRLLHSPGMKRAAEVVEDLEGYLEDDDCLLDIGTGMGHVAALLGERGFDVVAVDVEDTVTVHGVTPVLFDGKDLPFTGHQFDVALLITVLHHVADPEHLLREAGRVARRVIVQEDIHSSTLQKYATMGMDSLLNLEFRGHPHSNRSDAQWRATFERLGFELIGASSKSFGAIFSSGTYALRSPRGDREGPGSQDPAHT